MIVVPVWSKSEGIVTNILFLQHIRDNNREWRPVFRSLVREEKETTLFGGRLRIVQSIYENLKELRPRFHDDEQARGRVIKGPPFYTLENREDKLEDLLTILIYSLDTEAWISHVICDPRQCLRPSIKNKTETKMVGQHKLREHVHSWIHHAVFGASEGFQNADYIKCKNENCTSPWWRMPRGSSEAWVLDHVEFECRHMGGNCTHQDTLIKMNPGETKKVVTIQEGSRDMVFEKGGIEQQKSSLCPICCLPWVTEDEDCCLEDCFEYQILETRTRIETKHKACKIWWLHAPSPTAKQIIKVEEGGGQTMKQEVCEQYPPTRTIPRILVAKMAAAFTSSVRANRIETTNCMALLQNEIAFNKWLSEFFEKAIRGTLKIGRGKWPANKLRLTTMQRRRTLGDINWENNQ
jgi:hypothetical protein